VIQSTKTVMESLVSTARASKNRIVSASTHSSTVFFPSLTDECEEDQVPPSIKLKMQPPEKPFKSIEEARQFLENNLDVSDDCAVDLETTIVDPVDANTCTKRCAFRVTAVDRRCISVQPPGSSSATQTFELAVDRNGPAISCGFFTRQDPNHVSFLFDPCLGLDPPLPNEDDFLHIDRKCFGGKDLIDVNFWYQIEVSTCVHCAAFVCIFYTKLSPNTLLCFRPKSVMASFRSRSVFSAMNFRDQREVTRWLSFWRTKA